MIKGKKIIVAVTGSIAAYKAAFLVRLLIKDGAEVKVLMTRNATQFITPLTLATLSKNAVFSDVVDENEWNNHVELGLWADAMVIAPATANTIAKMANGICDNMVTAVYLSARCPIFIAPAMDVDMWLHPAVQNNIQNLSRFGCHIISVEYGELASGLVGNGRMAEPANIVAFLENFFQKSTDMEGVKILITAGPTHEPIDPVRFIGNRSSGKMGIAIAETAAKRGAKVTLILGPTHLPVTSLVKTIRVQTAQEMYDAALREFDEHKVAILSAAVADFKPQVVADQKIKKGTEEKIILELEKNPDIAAALGKRKGPDQFIVGFALETNNEMENAQAKLQKKNFDFVVLNSLNDIGAGFSHDTNKVTFLLKNGQIKNFQLKTKVQVAEDILNELQQLL